MQERIQNIALKTVNKLAAVTVLIKGKDSVLFHVVLLEKSKGEIIIREEKQNIPEIKELIEFIPKDYPVILNIEGWGVLIKKAEFDSNGEIKGAVVPNNNDFTVFPYQINENKGFVAIIRTELLEQIELDIGEQFKDCIYISVGPFDVIQLFNVLNLSGNCIIGSWEILFDQGAIKEIKSSHHEKTDIYSIGSETISSNNVLGLAIGIKLLSGNWDADELNKDRIADYAYKKLMFITGWSFLILLFLGLLVNYFLFDHYNKVYNRISGEYQLNESILEQLKQSESELKQKEEMVARGGLTGNTIFAWYSDQLISIMPVKIVLTRISIQPMERKMQKGKEVLFTPNLITITGNTKESLLVHEWINLIKKENWVDRVDLISFSNEEKIKPAQFTIELNYK